MKEEENMQIDRYKPIWGEQRLRHKDLTKSGHIKRGYTCLLQ